jgi:phage terminase large subunit-like protein
MDELGKIDSIRERLGVSYKEAKDALDRNGGDVVKALIELEGEKKPWTESVSVAGKDVVDKVKEIVQQGNVTKIRVRQGDKVIMDIPVTAGAISTILLPQLTLVGAAVALISDCTIEIERPDKGVVTLVEQRAEKS